MFGTQLHLIAMRQPWGAWAPVAIFASFEDAIAYFSDSDESLELFSPPGLVPPAYAGTYAAGMAYAAGYHD